MDIKIGLVGTAEEIVTDKNTAESFGSGNLQVYATPAMVALMEKASWTAVGDFLDEGTATVGTAVNIEHLSATVKGMKVTAKSVVTAVDGRKLSFSVEAFDETGIIGRGTHERFIINCEKFMQKAMAKKA